MKFLYHNWISSSAFLLTIFPVRSQPPNGWCARSLKPSLGKPGPSDRGSADFIKPTFGFYF